MILSKFLEEINQSLPTVESVMKKRQLGSVYDAQQVIESQKLIILKTENQNQELSSVLQLLSATNISEINIGGINFLDVAENFIPNVLEFAYFNDFLYFGETELKKVCIYDHENSITDQLTPNVDVFLDFLILYNSFDKKFVFNRDDLNSKEVKMKVQDLAKSGFNKNYLNDFFFDF